MNHPPGTVILPCQEQARYHRFTFDLAALQLPEGSTRSFGQGTSIVDNLNTAISGVPDSSEWVWIIGDDHAFEPDVVTRLLDRELDVVACLCSRRGPPWQLVHYDRELPEAPGYYHAIQIDELPDDGEPIEVRASGTTGMLIRRRVLDKLDRPLFRNSSETYLTEDLEFCERIREAGFKVMVDPSCRLGHMGTVMFYPHCQEGVWGLMVDFGQGHRSFTPGGIKLDSFGYVADEAVAV